MAILVRISGAEDSPDVYIESDWLAADAAVREAIVAFDDLVTEDFETVARELGWSPPLDES